VGRGKDAEWLGSIAFDGYPDGIPRAVRSATIETQYRRELREFFVERHGVTLPGQGWPWPWEDSRTTDYAYALDEGKVWASCFGSDWFDPMLEEPEDLPKGAIFPDMKSRQCVAFGPRSGMIAIEIDAEGKIRNVI
jgi:hypothetical protein